MGSKQLESVAKAAHPAKPSIGEVEETEWLLKHIPPGDMNQGRTHPLRVTSANFDLRDGETGISITRLTYTTPSELLSNLKCRAGSRVGLAQAKGCPRAWV